MVCHKQHFLVSIAHPPEAKGFKVASFQCFHRRGRRRPEISTAGRASLKAKFLRFACPHRAAFATKDSWRTLLVGLAAAIGAGELAVIAWIRNRYMDTPLLAAAFQVVVGGLLVFATGIAIGSSKGDGGVASVRSGPV